MAKENDILEVFKVTKSFGGLLVLKELSFAIKECEITALIGANGAGKTTAFNIITGFCQADSGKVRFRGKDICGRTPHDLVRKGIARSFQQVRLLGELTVLKNVLLGCQDQPGEGFSNSLLRPKKVRRQEDKNVEWAIQCLEKVGLEEIADEIVEELSYPDQKLVNLAQLLATRCEMLLLDEPASGLDAASIKKFLGLVKALPDRDKTVLVVEHNMSVVEELADHVLFLHNGEVYARGLYNEIVNQRELGELYFGTD